MDSKFLIISCPTKKFILSVHKILWMEWDAESKLLLIKMDNGDRYDLPNVMNISEIAEVLGVHPNAFKLRMLEPYDE